MSDPKSYGEPVDEPRPADDDVVVRAEDSLADAEAARREATEAADTRDPADAPDTVVETRDGTVVETSADAVVVEPAHEASPSSSADERPSAANGWAAEPPPRRVGSATART